MMLKKFRDCYPMGSLVGELIDIDRGLYIVRVLVKVEQTTLASGLAAADKIETAEDLARTRAIAALSLEPNVTSSSQIEPPSPPAPAAVSHDKETHSSPPNILEPVPQPVPLQSEQPEPKKPNPPTALVEPEPTTTTPVTLPVAKQTVGDTPTDNIATENIGNLFDGTYEEPAAETAPIPLASEEIEVSSPTPEPEPPKTTIDFYAIKHETDIELERLGWTNNEGRDFLKRNYGKPSRLRLTDEELLEFLQHLKSLPTPS